MTFANTSSGNVSFPAGDYVSPNLEPIRPDAAFPSMVVGDKSLCTWPYLRREVPHNFYVDSRTNIDSRAMAIGFVNRDEAVLLYNLARLFQGKSSLEIGCWLGWSTLHLALGGIGNLDVIDTMLLKPQFRQAVLQSLTAAGVSERVNLIGGYSPQAVSELGRGGRKYSLMFIDGNHEDLAPLNDAMACEPLAAQTAMVVFHDLVHPAVGRALDYYRERGWKTRIYQTAQIMGAAYRGDVHPVDHIPDPSVKWELPQHLRHHPLSHEQTPSPSANQ